MNLTNGWEIVQFLFLRIAADFQRSIPARRKGLLQLLQTGTLERFKDGRLVLTLNERLDLCCALRSLNSLDAASLHLAILPVGILVIPLSGIKHERNAIGSQRIMAVLITAHLDGEPGAISLLHLQRLRISRNSKGGLHEADHQ